MNIHVRCTECFSVYAIKRIQDTAETPINYCIYCGADTIVTGDIIDDDYWNVLVAFVGMPQNESSVGFLKELFRIWSPTEDDPPRFIDFVKKMVTESSLIN